MSISRTKNRRHACMRFSFTFLLALALGVGLAACGGGGGGADGAGQGLVLLSFSQASVDNAALNTTLEFEFSEAVDASTITSASIQIREGPAFGATIPGIFTVQGARLIWEPQLPGLCDNSDAALKPDTQYRVSVIGFPEEFSIRNTSGQPLRNTETYEFSTRPDTDPDKFIDQIPAVAPFVTSASPANGEEAVAVAPGNQVVLTMSENLDPCTVNDATVFFHIYQLGDAGTSVASNGGTGLPTGFATDATQATGDQTPGDPFTWTTTLQQASVNTLPTPQKILAQIQLEQTFASTQIKITPDFGFNPDPIKSAPLFPENALIVVQVTFGVTDFGGNSLTPFTMAFTTENRPSTDSTYLVDNEGETPYRGDVTTAEIHEPRAPSKVQGFLLFAGDSDNGPDPLTPTLPEDDFGPCTVPRQVNDGIPDDFDPVIDVVLDTGATRNLCPNSTDGSLAVIWEFRTFRIRNGITVRVVGNNPAIILVQGDVVIEQGGVLLLRSDGSAGTPTGRGANGHNDTTSGNPPDAAGGRGVAGGGNGGQGTAAPINTGLKKGQDGFDGYGTGTSDDHGSTTTPGGPGTGEGGSGVDAVNSSNPWPSGSSGAGGGGGHAIAGVDGPQAIGAGTTLLVAGIGKGGGVVPNRGDADQMPTPSAGGGGGGAGYSVEPPGTFKTGGGGAGAGGGFIDLTSSGDIVINGTIDATGSRGGSGGNEAFHGGGGGGGGAGGGIRLLTPNSIGLGGGAVVSTAGGTGGNGSRGTSSTTGPINNGGAGGSGRVVMEDSDSIISGLGAASVTPSEGTPGFWRGLFDAGRFKGGGLNPQGITEIFGIGPLNPDFDAPVAADFVAGVPVIASRGIGMTSIMVEVQGYQMLPDGTPDLGSASGWVTACRFVDSGVEGAPTLVYTNPGDVPVTVGNVGTGIDTIDGAEFIQLRFSFWLPNTVGPFDAGPFVDDWTIKFSHDQ